MLARSWVLRSPPTGTESSLPGTTSLTDPVWLAMVVVLGSVLPDLHSSVVVTAGKVLAVRADRNAPRRAFGAVEGHILSRPVPDPGRAVGTSAGHIPAVKTERDPEHRAVVAAQHDRRDGG